MSRIGTMRQRTKLKSYEVPPITHMTQAKEYMDSNHIPKMFQSLLSSLMMEKPDDQFMFLNTKLDAIKEIGIENVDWEAFIYHLHPMRDPVRNQHVHTETPKKREDQRPFADIDEQTSVKEVKSDDVSVPSDYKPELFLTEPDDEDSLSQQ